MNSKAKNYFLTITALFTISLLTLTSCTKKKPTQMIERLEKGEKITVAALGTSLTGGTWRWFDVMKEWLEADYPGQISYINRGVGASASTFPDSLSGIHQAKSLAGEKPDVVFIEFATNDSYIPYKISVDESYKALEDMILLLRKANPEVEIIIQSMNLPIDMPERNMTEGALRKDLEKYLLKHKNLASKYELQFIDHYSNWKDFYDRLGRNEYLDLVPDGVHPNLNGYRTILLPELKRSLKGQVATQSWSKEQLAISTDYFSLLINDQGFINSMKNTTRKGQPEFSPKEKPSPLLCIYDSKADTVYQPLKATFEKDRQEIHLIYPNRSKAIISIAVKEKYFKLKLLSLSNREHIEDIQWGPYHTNISNLFGEIIGVARDTSEVVNYAIGMMALDDNTIGGTSRTIADAAPFQYIIHSPDSIRYPLPDNLHEGQVFTLGGDGISDVAFYAHKEPYFRIMYGDAAMVDKKGQISINYHSRDRSKKREVYYSLIPNMPANTPNHLQVQPLPGVDYIGSSVALWGGPDHLALIDIIKSIVINEKLPYPTFNGKWVKDPAAYMPEVMSKGKKYDSILSYTSQLGLKAISMYDQPFLKPDRGNEGYIDGKKFERKPIHFSSGDLSHKEYAELAAKLGISIGRTTITNSLAPGTKDASPVPSDSLCYQQKRLLVNDLSPTDTIILVDDPRHLEEIASWEGHAKNLNMVKIGKELIHYLGVSENPPYRLLHVKRGYWGTESAHHTLNDTIYKLQVTLNYGYDGLIPNMELQDEIAKYYADICKINGLGYYDFDGQEFLFNNGHGYYSAKRFFGKMFARAEEHGLPPIRFTGATLSEGSWHYQSIWNVGSGTNLYDVNTREWGSSTSQGKDLRDVTYANFFPTGMGGNFEIKADSKASHYEHIQAISVGIGTTYSLILDQENVEKCPEKQAIFKVISTWEKARGANAFPRKLKRLLAEPHRDWRLVENNDGNSWKLYELKEGTIIRSFDLYRQNGY